MSRLEVGRHFNRKAEACKLRTADAKVDSLPHCQAQAARAGKTQLQLAGQTNLHLEG
jgi:hypothetical protein